jgi:hypothetical protein
MENIARHQLIVAIIAIVVAALVTVAVNWARMVKEWRQLFYEPRRQKVLLALSTQPFGWYFTELMLNTKLSHRALRKTLDTMQTAGEVKVVQDCSGLETWSRVL